MVNLELKEFAEATRRMIQLSGVKKSRLMLRVRPTSGRKTFVLKSTDGRTTLTTRVTHQGELKIVEGVVNDFVGSCTAALVPQALPTSTQSKQVEKSGGSGGNIDSVPQSSSTGGKGGNKQGGKTESATNINTQQQKPQQGNKKRKGNRR